ncbi:hypothetical protein ACWV26_03245 [Rummeliibacillus sp. JY-2-4R]
MRIKSFVSMGLAAMLIAPTLITAANPELAHAKTASKTSSKKVSAKAKSVIAKIKAINPKKTNYIANTKSAESAYKKLSSKDKKMVSNYAILKKHWSKIQPSLKKINNLTKKVATLNTKNYATKIASLKKQYDSLNRITKAAVPKTTVTKLNYYDNRKANLVIAQIKAINSKKSDYIAKTKSAMSAYNKLSKTDKKKVTNYSTLKKHWTNIQPYLKKVDSFNKSVSTLSKTNFATKSVALEKQYDSLNTITKAAVPSTTLKKLSYYTDVVGTQKLMLMSVAPSTTVGTPDGTNILNTINAYKKLSGAQQVLLRDLVDKTTTDSNGETSLQKLDRYLALEDVVKDAADIQKKYVAVKPSSKTYAQDLVAVLNDYNAVKGKSIDYTNKDNNVTTFKVSEFVPQASKISDIGTAYATQISAKDSFTNAVDGLTSASTNNDVQTVVTKYKSIQAKSPADNSVSGNYPSLAPIDLVGKTTLTTYNKFAPIPDMVKNFGNLPTFPTTPGSLNSTAVSNAANLLTQYNKLGADQKSIVQNTLATASNNAKDYLPEAKNISSAQAIDKSYDTALKNKAKPSYFVDLLKAHDAYINAIPEVQRFVVNATAINKIPSDSGYSAAKTAVDNFTNAVNSIPSATDSTTANDAITKINGVMNQYKTISSKPSWLALVDRTTLTTYNNYAQVPDVLSLGAKLPSSVPYQAKDITNILSAISGYKKLATPQKQIVDIKYPSLSDFVADSANINAAQKIDSSYLKLKKSSNTYPKDAKNVYDTFNDASAGVQKYVVNSSKINSLLSAFTPSQNIANTFENKVNALSKKSNPSDVEGVVDFYTTNISTSPKVSSLVDKAVLKKYNDYAPVSNVVRLLSLIKESYVNSPAVTPTDVKYIQQATIAYNALKPDPKMIIDDADRSKFPFLYDGKYIKEAVAIDQAYEKVKPTDDKYELEILDVYYKMYDRAPAIVQKYVANKAELDKIGTRYQPQLTIARDFETKVRQMSHISESGFTPTIITVRSLEKYYDDNVKYNKINAKYNVPLSTLIDPNIMEEYRKYSLILQIQDIAKTIYVLYGKLFNDENVEFDKVKDNFYCNNAPTKDPSRCHPKNGEPSDYYEISKKGFTDSGRKDGNPIKITNPNDIKLIYKAIDYFQQLDTPQTSILKKAPSSLTDTYYKDRYGGNNNPNTEEGDVHLSIPMSDGEIKNFLKAQEIDKEYEALKPSSKTYIQDAIVLYYKFYKAGRPVQLYVIHEKDLKAFKDGYGQAPNNKIDKLINGVDTFVKAVNLLSNDSSLSDVVDGVVDQYNKLNEAQLAVIDQGVLSKYNAYAPIADIEALTKTLPASGAYSDPNIDNMLKAIAIYKKLAKDPKAIVANLIKSDSNYYYLADETEIKAAQKVDKSFKALDKSDDKYLTNLKSVIKSYDALSSTAKTYVTSNIEVARQSAIYANPNTAASDFEKAVNDLLDKYPMTYTNVKDVVDKYNLLSSKAKSLVDSNVLKTYNKYVPIVTVVANLGGITLPDYNNLDDDPTTSKPPVIGYYQNNGEGDVGTVILDAIQLYNKLGSIQKDIVLNTVSTSLPVTSDKPLTAQQFALLKETNNIKAAQALDKKIAAIKPKTSSYINGIIDAKKTLEVMPKEQRVYLLNAATLDGYETKSQTKKAIDDLSTFEKGVQQVDQWTSEIQKDASGNIIGTCKDTTTNPETDAACNTLITNKMVELKNLFDLLNTPRIVDGAEITLAPLIDRTILTRYQYFRAIYDVIDQL